MGRDTGGVRGMDVGEKGEVIAMDVARDDMDMLVVTDSGYGKRTKIDQYRKTSRGAKGVLTIKLTEAKGGLAGALVVRPHQELVFISQNGMIQRTGVKGISQQGRSATGVRVMNPRDGDQVSAVALIAESEDESGEPTLDVEGEELNVAPSPATPRRRCRAEEPRTPATTWRPRTLPSKARRTTRTKPFGPPPVRPLTVASRYCAKLSDGGATLRLPEKGGGPNI